MPLLTVKDVAARLQVKEKTIYTWVCKGKIPCVKLTGVIRFDERDIEQWLQECHVRVRPAREVAKNRRRSATIHVDHLIESAKRAVYTAQGETKPIASPYRKEAANGAR